MRNGSRFNGGHRSSRLRSGFSSLKCLSGGAGFSSRSPSLRLNSLIRAIVVGPFRVINTRRKSVGSIFERLI